MIFVPNTEQKKAIEHVHGPMLVVAGAGTGKTTVLSQRIALLIEQGNAKADEILALTYTDAAAAHLKVKVAEALGVSDSGVHAYTFHAYCLRTLKAAGLDFGIVDEKDLWILLRRRIEELPLKHFLPPRDPGEFLDALKEFFSRCSDELVDAGRYQKYVEDLAAGKYPLPRVAPSKKDAELGAEDKLARCWEIASVFRAVERMLVEGKLWTYGNMISGAVKLFKENVRALEAAQQRARFILVDEFQDANVAQIELVRLLGGEAQNVFAVGDPDQAIYRFRGASHVAFEEFLKRFPNSRGVVLKENQRSTSHILACAHSVICRNPEVDCRLSEGVDFQRERLISARELRSRTLQPVPIGIVLGDRFQEATDIATEIETLVGNGTVTTPASGEPPPIAVIYRLHSHAREIMYELAARDIPTVVKGIDALDTGEGRDLVAALAAVASLSNSEDLFRVAALPFFGLDGKQVRDELNSAKREASFATLLARIADGKRVMAKVEAARAFAAAQDWQAVPICEFVVREFAFDSGSAPVRRIVEFVHAWKEKAITQTGKLEEFIEYLGLFADARGKLDISPDNPGAVVQLMTVHGAKGLEFERVYVLRANSGLFPFKYCEEMFEFPQELREMGVAADAKQLQQQEERRLFYVALTRAKDQLSVYAKPGRGKDPSPAGLLRELMADKAVKGSWTQRVARPHTVTLQAGTQAVSGVGSWMLLPPSAHLAAEPVLSPTAMEDFEACPLKYKLRRDWQIPGPVWASLTFGNVVHEVLRDIHQAEVAGRPRTEGDVVQRFSDLMEEAPFDDALQQRLYREQGVKQLSEYVRLRGVRKNPAILHVENNFQVKVAGVPVKGRMDLVDRGAEGLRVVDFKTGSPYTKEKADDSLQLGIYAAAARELWGEVPNAVTIYNLDGNTEVASTRNSDALREVEEKVIAVAAGIKDAAASGEFPAKEGFYCHWCDFRNLCPAKEENLYTLAAAAERKS